MRTTVSIGLLGCGTVGGGVAELLLRERAQIESRCGIDYQIAGIVVRSAAKERPTSIPQRLFTRDAAALIDDPNVDLIVECIGGVDDAREYVERALERGKHVVTANKELIATDGPRLSALAASSRVSLQFEAAVCSAIPIVRTLEESLAGEDVLDVAGVLNGTSNFILTAMHEGQSYDDALVDAQRRGFAEADPRDDVDGVDAAHKLAILCQLAFHTAITSPRIARTGITKITPDAIALASRQGYAIKLLGFARNSAIGCSAEVAPVFVPLDHPFARTRGAENCVRVVGRAVGPLTFSGLGAGRYPGASAIVGDVVAALRSIGTRRRTRSSLAPALAVAPAFNPFQHIQVSAVRYPVWRDVLDLPHLTKERTHDDYPRTSSPIAL
ncbi:MAG: homoserine dehydrogenase [Candidatus Baltobacteraceae bacterium]